MAELKFSVNEMGDVVVLGFEGPIHMGGGDIVLKDTTRQQIENGSRKIVLDLSKVSTIDSTGIGELVSLATTARRKGGEIRLAALTRKIKDIMEIVRLNTVFSCHDTVDEAVKSFKS